MNFCNYIIEYENKLDNIENRSVYFDEYENKIKDESNFREKYDRIKRKKIDDFLNDHNNDLLNFLINLYHFYKILIEYHALFFNKNFIFMNNFNNYEIFFDDNELTFIF